MNQRRRVDLAFNSKSARFFEVWRVLETLVSIALAASPLSLAAFAVFSGA